MKNKPLAKIEKETKTSSSISVSSQTVCEDEACIGKVVNVPAPSAKPPHRASKKPKRQSVTAMSFGGKQGCTDEACIGKT